MHPERYLYFKTTIKKKLKEDSERIEDGAWNINKVPLIQSDQQLDCALDLMRRLPPQQCEKNLNELIGEGFIL